ncbi:rhodanese-like domain-containing protein [Aquirhabdus parva]|uniref:Rhodanese-like domain-containing protein n=1 Tax=Aquirhabdus parva TaxID=2283318 RepID=A0A345P4W7_9GAMM|nr:rhodanese-like domain-containing protein [Aquirhabdus parva]AXI02326.1 rhodanese-like domain-containing protein [Aquirhabdus parva]
MNKFSPIVLSVLISVVTGHALAADADAAKPQQPAEHAYTAKSPKLNRAQIDALLAQPEKLVIVDVRRPDELSSVGAFPAYLNIQAKDLENRLAYIPKDRSVVTVSNHAGRAGPAADFLASKGFKVAGAIGVQDYEAEGGTLIKVTKPQPKPSADASAKAAQ